MNVCIGHAGSRTDDAFDNLIAENASALVELHDATEDQAVFAGPQAANIGREFLGKHGNGAIGEIDAGSAQTGFQIEIRRGTHVLRHIGDVNL